MALNRGRYLVAIPRESETGPGPGVSDKASLQKAFPASPFGELGASANDVITQVFLERVLGENGFQREYDSTLFTADQVGINYDNSPNLAEVRTTEAGDPSSPYAPNITSPTQGVDPLSQNPDAGVEVITRLGDVGIVGNGVPWPTKTGTNQPNQAAQTISSQTLTNIVGKFGTSDPNGKAY